MFLHNFVYNGKNKSNSNIQIFSKLNYNSSSRNSLRVLSKENLPPTEFSVSASSIFSMDIKSTAFPPILGPSIEPLMSLQTSSSTSALGALFDS